MNDDMKISASYLFFFLVFFKTKNIFASAGSYTVSENCFKGFHAKSE